MPPPEEAGPSSPPRLSTLRAPTPRLGRLPSAQLSATDRTPLLAPSPRSPAPVPPTPHSVSRSGSGFFGSRPRTNRTRSRARQRGRRPPVHLIPIGLICLLFLVAILFAWDASPLGKCYISSVCRMLGGGKEEIEEVWWRNAGQYAPWKSLGNGGGKKGLPRGCVVDQVNILHRHASRYPTSGAGTDMKRVLEKIKNRGNKAPRKHPELAFLNRVDYDLAGWEFDELLDQGRRTSWESGKDLADTYAKYFEHGEHLFSRAGGQSRVVETAGYWLEGFNGQKFHLKDKRKLPLPDVIIPEIDSSNNTLSTYCPVDDAVPATYAAVYDLLQPIMDRLNWLLQPHPPLEKWDVMKLADMCPYDSLLRGEDWEGWSRWCSVFRREEWEVIGHVRDAEKYHGVGQGSYLGATRGIGWVQEMIARLNDTHPAYSSALNNTLDSSNSTFPPGGQRIFADFSHDSDMLRVMTALRVIDQHRPPALDSVPDKRSYLLSHLIPFGARLVVERLACDLGNWEPDDPGMMTPPKDGKKSYVRVLINDKIYPINHLACRQSGFVEHHMCELDLFVESQSWSLSEADYSRCFE